MSVTEGEICNSDDMWLAPYAACFVFLLFVCYSLCRCFHTLMSYGGWCATCEPLNREHEHTADAERVGHEPKYLAGTTQHPQNDSSERLSTDEDPVLKLNGKITELESTIMTVSEKLDTVHGQAERVLGEVADSLARQEELLSRTLDELEGELEQIRLYQVAIIEDSTALSIVGKHIAAESQENSSRIKQLEDMVDQQQQDIKKLQLHNGLHLELLTAAVEEFEVSARDWLKDLSRREANQSNTNASTQELNIDVNEHSQQFDNVEDNSNDAEIRPDNDLADLTSETTADEVSHDLDKGGDLGDVENLPTV